MRVGWVLHCGVWHQEYQRDIVGCSLRYGEIESLVFAEVECARLCASHTNSGERVVVQVMPKDAETAGHRSFGVFVGWCLEAPRGRKWIGSL